LLRKEHMSPAQLTDALLPEAQNESDRQERLAAFERTEATAS
jgi:hypothetical protein